ncbi:MAG: TlpA family protein disulfide reductase [Candidatus Omnitrophica bacterium]|nr:TlpA family protein disulfide reductase [Candidatus Omnitrophota bacterium]
MRNLFFLFFLFTLMGCASKEAKKAPEVVFNTIDGKVIKIIDYKGKKIVLNFWSVNCSACIREIPEIVDFYNENKEKVGVISVVILSSKKDVEDLIKKYKINFPICLGDEKIADLFGGIIFLPTTFIIDEDGYIRLKINGAIGKVELEKILKSLDYNEKAKKTE